MTQRPMKAMRRTPNMHPNTIEKMTQPVKFFSIVTPTGAFLLTANDTVSAL
jgi:hypothetical protein